MHNKFLASLMFLSLLCVNSFVSACQKPKHDKITDMVLVIKGELGPSLMPPDDMQKIKDLILDKKKYKQLGCDVSNFDDSRLFMLESATCMYDGQRVDLIKDGLHFLPETLSISFPKLWPKNLLDQLGEKGTTINGILYKPEISTLHSTDEDQDQMEIKNQNIKREAFLLLEEMCLKHIAYHQAELIKAQRKLIELNKRIQDNKFIFRAKVFVVGIGFTVLLAVMCWFNKDCLQGYFGK